VFIISFWKWWNNLFALDGPVSREHKEEKDDPTPLDAILLGQMLVILKFVLLLVFSIFILIFKATETSRGVKRKVKKKKKTRVSKVKVAKV
jgi:hypothetical protein